MLDHFHAFAKAVNARYTDMARGELFVTEPLDIFESYLAAFPDGTNPLFRERTEHDCSCCKNFVRHLGRLVSIDGGCVSTIWDIPGLPHPYDVVAARLNALVRQAPIVSVYRTKESRYGTEFNYDTETSTRWNHFHGRVGSRHLTPNPDKARGDIGTTVEVMRRGLDESTIEAFTTVLDLIADNAIYRGAEFKAAVTAFRDLQRAYHSADNKNLFVWAHAGSSVARFRNTVIGTLVTELSEGVAIEAAVAKFESKVAPENYKRTTSLITPKMIDVAMATLKGLDLEGAIERRMAKITDVSVNNVLFVDNAVRGQMRDGLAGLLMEAVKPPPVDIKHAVAISAEEFFASIVPQAHSIDLLVENKHLGNFVTLTAPVHENTGRLFRWHNDFAWMYDGDVADSIKQRVKAAGGKIDAKLRVSLAWTNFDDLDLHVREPFGGDHIYFGHKISRTGGRLDVDMNAGHGATRVPVENVYWNAHLPNGEYQVSVHNFAKRESSDVGFTLEVEGFGFYEQFSYKAAVADRSEVPAVCLTVAGGRLTSIKPFEGVVGGTTGVDKWGITTHTLVPVDTLMLSPNYWDGLGVGNKHWFFFLKGCKNPDEVRGFLNEYLRPEFEAHRKVFEVLGAKTKAHPSPDQLSGLGFSSTGGGRITAVVKGESINRAYTINF